MDLKCEVVWLEISNYVDAEVDSTLRAEMDRHIVGCRRCSSVLAGTKNVVQIYGDARLFSIPAEFSPSLHRRISMQYRPERGAAFTWVVSVAGVGLVAAAMAVFSLPRFAAPPQRAPMSEPALQVPAPEMVAVAEDGKTFHVPGCTYLHGPWKMMPVDEALRKGYNPCIRCEAKLIHQKEQARPLSVVPRSPALRSATGD